MKFNKIAKKFAAAALAGVLMVSSMGMTASAEGATGNVTVDSSLTNGVSFTKTLDMSNAVGASVPNVTFEYTIEAGTGVIATENNGVKTPEILAGVGTPIVGTAEYTSSDEAGSSVEKTVSVDFSNVTFSAPGIYRYKITEVTSSVAGVTDDTDKTRYLDVYVENNSDNTGYVITAYVLLKTPTTPTLSTEQDGSVVANYGESLTTKTEGYVNTYTTQSLTLTKNVQGTMANMSEKFSFTLNFSNVPVGVVLTYKIGNGTEATVIADADGTAKIENIELNNSTGSLVITGIPEDVKYTITENIDSKDGYTTTYVQTGSTTSVSSTTTTEKSVAEGTDEVVTFTNEKNSITPTGIALSIAPYVLMVAFAGVIAVLFLRKRKYEI